MEELKEPVGVTFQTLDETFRNYRVRRPLSTAPYEDCAANSSDALYAARSKYRVRYRIELMSDMVCAPLSGLRGALCSAPKQAEFAGVRAGSRRSQRAWVSASTDYTVSVIHLQHNPI